MEVMELRVGLDVEKAPYIIGISGIKDERMDNI